VLSRTFSPIAREASNDYSTLRGQFQDAREFRVAVGPDEICCSGPNGSGKSNVLEAIRLIRKFLCEGETSTALFPASSLCRWDTRKVQTFEIDLRNSAGTINYAYRLEIEHDRDGCFVKSEQLSYERQPVYSSQAGYGEFRRSDGVSRVRFNRNRSGVGIFDDDALLSDFKQRLNVVWSLHINPDKMLSECDAASIRPDEDMSNFAAWYQHLVLDRSTVVFKLAEVFEERRTRWLPFSGSEERRREIACIVGGIRSQNKRKLAGTNYQVSFQ